MNKETKTNILALSTIAIWSTIASAFKLTLNQVEPKPLVFFASFFALLIHFISVLINKTGFKISLNEFKKSLILGFFNPFLYYFILLQAYKILPAQSAQVINYSWAVTLSIMSFIFLGQKPSKKDIFAILTCYTGIFIIATKGNINHFNTGDIKGVFFALTSTIIWALYWIFNTKDDINPEKRLFFNFIAGTVYSGIFLLFSSKNIVCIGNISKNGIYGCFYIGLFEMGISFILWLKAMKLTDNTSRISNFIYLSPFISIFIIKYTVHEEIMIPTMIGLGLIITGIMVQNIKQKR